MRAACTAPAPLPLYRPAHLPTTDVTSPCNCRDTHQPTAALNNRAGIFLLLLFTTPFYRVPLSWDGYVGDIGSWAFTSLFLAGMLALTGVYVFHWAWEDYVPYEPATRSMTAKGGDVEVAVGKTAAGSGSGASREGVAVAAGARV